MRGSGSTPRAGRAAMIGLAQQLRPDPRRERRPDAAYLRHRDRGPDRALGHRRHLHLPGPGRDAARAATLSLAGDALAHSDCGVDSYDIYALIGSGTNLEPALEGYMGILNYTTGAPNVTGQAIIAASQRWQTARQAASDSAVARDTRPGALLPLGLSLAHTSPTCVGATVTYYGNPLEGAACPHHRGRTCRPGRDERVRPDADVPRERAAAHQLRHCRRRAVVAAEHCGAHRAGRGRSRHLQLPRVERGDRAGGERPSRPRLRRT